MPSISEDDFELNEGYACFRPVGPTTARAVVALMERALRQCKAAAVTKLLVDVTRLTHEPITTVQRFDYASGIAEFWDRSIKVSVFARADQLEPERFGVLVAQNRGWVFFSCASEAEALKWLLEP